MITVFLSLCIVIVFMHFCTWIGREVEHRVQLHSYSNWAEEPKAIFCDKNRQTTCGVSTGWNHTCLSREHNVDYWKSFSFNSPKLSSHAKFAPHNFQTTSITMRSSECVQENTCLPQQSKPQEASFASFNLKQPFQIKYTICNFCH